MAQPLFEKQFCASLQMMLGLPTALPMAAGQRQQHFPLCLARKRERQSRVCTRLGG